MGKKAAVAKQQEEAIADRVNKEKGIAAAAASTANNLLNATEEAKTKAAEAKQELNVQLDARRNQDDKTSLAKKAAKVEASIAATTTHAAKAKTEEALLLASKKQQEADLAKQRAP